MKHQSGLHLLRLTATQHVHDEHSEKDSLVKTSWRTRTDITLTAKGDKAISVSKLDAYLGLEMAMSMIPITDIKEFWSDKLFLSRPDFKATMSRNRIQAMRESFQLHPPFVTTVETSQTEAALEKWNNVQDKVHCATVATSSSTSNHGLLTPLSRLM
ncbi:hypothetical protein PHMEG_00013402 [Phytophthora megakarya]|uniref:PiggyBac transposable element-derived protein domain-containing protein n=1 Tax=Phytophthora megakarya TaxID=4795 RepID=A0A225W6S3_9STRA|nr:hypothetical protein PHMEG_00013402 [Phytophthora megakarya]